VAWPADLKLMGIFFSKSHPMALINNQTLGVGELIEGVRVTKIERDRVSVEWHGQVKELMTK
jgi:type II secretory pathway component PulC